ncbi:HNH endonuclease [Rhodovulum sulfidophilum]|uniref:HNH endonuclease n=1 Tax=Rhodovulum sulfidophilum TaxID=35806 RepID=UPI001F17E5F1|nr:HNH endonuclease [Rhodovulum sulfidophilum]MCE8438453.1 HNH endonuclease [Rhodovulum sulfidophilum]MCE8470059.1 HNH endonuclease [Rhodovulum sulfidophilum]
MVKLVLLHKADSIYEDEPDVVYDFPRSYLKAVEQAVGDWIVYYEPVKAGPRGYFAVAKINRVIPKPCAEGRFLAMIEPGSFLPFDREVPRLLDGRPLEAALTAPDGTPKKGGAAYGYRCAMSGLMLRNGGGRPEVQAAHIRPVESQGNDTVRNGLALSGTLHWMFDRGLISVAEDCETVLVSHNKVPGDVVGRLLAPDGKLVRPEDARDAPHSENLRWHRENVFGRSLPGGPAPYLPA